MKRRSNAKGGGPNIPPPDSSGALPTGPTGRQLIVLRPESQSSLTKALKDTAGLKVAASSDFGEAVFSDADLGEADTLILEHLGVAVVDADSDQLKSLSMAVMDEGNPIMSIEPESYVQALCDPAGSSETEDATASLLTTEGREYLRGYADAIQAIASRMLGEAPPAEDEEARAAAFFSDTAALTWGLQATKVNKCAYTGAGIRVAVLDTGFDFNHPDFAGRSIIKASFVPGQSPQDGHSHGTHCIGTSCGPKTPAGTRRYGIAHGATILVGKVLNNQGSGMDGWILAGINWAIQNKAVVISMSLGSMVAVGTKYKNAYEQAALAALNNNCLIVAAAGNSGDDPVYFPVGSPANCPSVMAVAAVDNALQRASFSCTGANPAGGEVDIAAPGVGTYSSVPMPTRYGVKSGTSMATPHVAGIAALLAQQTGLRGKALWQKMTASALKIGQSAQKVGAGLIQAPVSRVVVPVKPISLPTPLPREVPELTTARAEGRVTPAVVSM